MGISPMIPAWHGILPMICGLAQLDYLSIHGGDALTDFENRKSCLHEYPFLR
jgi:hypothetical protein